MDKDGTSAGATNYDTDYTYGNDSTYNYAGSQADGVVTGLEKIAAFNPDVVLLDVEMNDGTGFELLKQLVHPMFQLIFTTAHNQYALQALKSSAIDYLLKPIDPIELNSSLEKATANIENNNLQKQLAVLMSQLSHKNDIDKQIVLKRKRAANDRCPFYKY